MAVPPLDDLRREVLNANKRIASAGLAALTWGNVSGVDREAGVYVIKPSGVSYEELTADLLVPVAIDTGEVLAGDLRPSVDSESHRFFYQQWPGIGGVCHTHSTNAVAFAQAKRGIPVLGTTHADTFAGPVPVTRDLTPAECDRDYELNTARAISELFTTDVAHSHTPSALAASHGPFCWGPTATAALENAIVCEAVADMALKTLMLNTEPEPAPWVLDTHFRRKHGPSAYYGNKPTG